MTSLKQRADLVLAVSATHRDRMAMALAHLQGQVPRTGGELAHADYAVIASAELLTSRFAKLQDHLGAQLVPLALELSAEPLPSTATFMDRLLRLEKLRAVPSVVEFRRLRELRNSLAHDYPDDPDEAVAGLHAVIAAVPALLEIEAALRGFVEKLLERGQVSA